MKLHKSWGYALIVFGLVLLTGAVGKLIHMDEYVAAEQNQQYENGEVYIGQNMEQFGEEMDRFGQSMEQLAEGFSDGHLVTAAGEEQVEIEKIKRLKLENNVGQIKITADPNAKKMTLKFIKKLNTTESKETAEQRLKNVGIDINYGEDGTVYVSSSGYYEENWMKQFRIDYELIVPPTLAVELYSKVGDITIVGLQSDLHVEANVAKIDIDGFKGSLNVKNNTGAISVKGGQAIKELEVNSNVGALTVQLPEQANVTVDAKTNVGALDTEFQLNERRTGPSKSVQGQIGQSGGQVNLNTNTGSISILKQAPTPPATDKPADSIKPATNTQPAGTNKPATTTPPAATDKPATTTQPAGTNKPAANTQPATNQPGTTTPSAAN
ncbi:hypothetical protein CBW65_21830 [Tumebacillus avium]|uniref:DUF4097 domain-containing protein n=1 Tax=Tumebacillus avium TaxID=1903704 RepID=A0A1Y0IS40_9BACL|nr:DUF4097 family beta strand repeat-containing protein [Tumebacillus avium]ARU63331.1 hypothetical protein CBW65_21830 [Tumebacillus avium]